MLTRLPRNDASKNIYKLFIQPVAVLFAIACPLAAQPDLEILDGNYPVSFFFRQSEADASLGRMSYEEWEAGYSRMSGVMGKMLDEEVIGRSAGQAYFRRFKQDHPRQAVLLHVNGGFRKPIADISAYHDGHWLYYNGARVLDDITQSKKQIVIRVSDVSVFMLHPYRSNTEIAEDIAICALDAAGKPDWNHAEQGRLVAIDEKSGTVTVERSIYGDRKRHDYKGGQAYIASHVAQNWGTRNTLWEFNMSTTCPRDASGKQAADVWAKELIEAMQPGGQLDFIDGFQFDVPFIHPISIGRDRKPDANSDGLGDGGIVAGEPVFTLGVEGFFRKLRSALPDMLIMADSGGKSQRSTKYLNGMETEGFPELKDTEFHYWSTAINYHRFWDRWSAKPRFHYGLMKYLRWPETPQMSDSRLIMAGTTLHSAAVPLGRLPDKPSYYVYDEILGGKLDRKGWLGKPLGPARRIGLEKKGLPGMVWDPGNTRMSQHGREIEFSRKSDRVIDLRFSLGNLQHKGGDLLMRMEVAADQRKGYPEGYYRELFVELSGDADVPPHLGETTYASPVGKLPFDAVFYLRDVPPGTYSFDLIVEGNEPFRVLDYSVHPSADLTVREYENGVVLANPSSSQAVLDVAKLFPDMRFRHLSATDGQDTAVNTAQPVGELITIDELDAVFLVKEP